MPKMQIILINCISVYILHLTKFVTSNTPKCNGVDYAHGKWVEDVSLWNDPSQNFLCCGGVNYEELGNQEFDNVLNPKVSHICKADVAIYDHGCSCMARHMQSKYKETIPYIFNEATEREYRYFPNSVKYRWETSQCELHDWNAYKFCEVLGKKKVLIIGDSTSNQVSGTLKSMIFQANITDDSLYQCQKQIKFHWSDLLVASKYHYSSGRGNSIAGDILEEGSKGNFFDIIIFGNFHGTHMTSAFGYNYTDPRFGDALLVKISQNIGIARKYYEENQKPLPKFIYKTVSLPHSNCLNKFNKGAILSESSNDIFKLKELNSHGLGKKYNWAGETKLEHGIVEGICREDDISVIRMSPLVNRPDGHPPPEFEDCLHYCTPGEFSIPSLFLFLYDNNFTINI